MAHGGDVIHELTGDHHRVGELIASIETAPPDAGRRRRLADELTAALRRHWAVEERHLYPAVREHVPGGTALADKEVGDHARAKETLKALEECDADDPGFDSLVSRLKAEVQTHIDDEEHNVFRELREACDPAELGRLGEELRRDER
jgi:hypothetical protein